MQKYKIVEIIHKGRPQIDIFADIFLLCTKIMSLVKIQEQCDKNVCNYLCKIPGIRFVALVNKNGKKISGGFSPGTIPLVKDERRLDTFFIEIALDLAMRKEFDDSLGSIHAIVSYRANVNIVTIPHQDNLLVVSSYPELEPSRVIQFVYQNLNPSNIFEAESH